MQPTPCGQTVCNIHHFRNQNWVSQDKASRRVLFYAFRIFWSCIGWPGVFVHNASASFALALPIYPAGMAGQSGRTSSTFKFCRVNLRRGLKCATCLQSIRQSWSMQPLANQRFPTDVGSRGAHGLALWCWAEGSQSLSESGDVGNGAIELQVAPIAMYNLSSYLHLSFCHYLFFVIYFIYLF